MYNIDSGIITFVWPENTGIRENLPELIRGIHDAGQHSLSVAAPVRVMLPGYTEHGWVEGRSTRNRRWPIQQPGLNNGEILSTNPYYLLSYELDSPYYALSIPGLCQLMDSRLLAVNNDFTSDLNLIFNEVFNVELSSLPLVPIPSYLVNYANMPRTLAHLTKRPRTIKTIDFAPIFVAIFGEKIATVILKEIK